MNIVLMHLQPQEMYLGSSPTVVEHFMEMPYKSNHVNVGERIFVS